MRIAQHMVDEMVAHAREEHPNECCGMIASLDGEAVRLFRAENTAASPLRYEIDPQEQLRIMSEMDDRGWELGAIYHSHTRSRAYPSQTDVNLAFYPGALHVIVSLEGGGAPEVRAFRIVEEQISETELEIAGG